MTAIPLNVEQVTWCAQHGHPVLVLRQCESDNTFGIGVSVEDAQVFAASLGSVQSGKARLYELVERLLAWFDGQVAGIRLGPCCGGVLQAHIEIDGPNGRLDLPVQVVDAVLLAWRNGTPILISDTDLAEVVSKAGSPKESRDVDTRSADQPEAFRAFIETLDLD